MCCKNGKTVRAHTHSVDRIDWTKVNSIKNLKRQNFFFTSMPLMVFMYRARNNLMWNCFCDSASNDRYTKTVVPVSVALALIRPPFSSSEILLSFNVLRKIISLEDKIANRISVAGICWNCVLIRIPWIRCEHVRKRASICTGHGYMSNSFRIKKNLLNSKNVAAAAAKLFKANIFFIHWNGLRNN